MAHTSPDDPHPYEPCPGCGRMLAPDNEYTDRGLTLPAYCCPDCNRRVFFYLGQPPGRG